MPRLMYRMDGHKMILVEGIPTVFSWQHIEQFNGKEWVVPEWTLTKSRSAFTVASVPGHFIPNCHPEKDDRHRYIPFRWFK